MSTVEFNQMLVNNAEFLKPCAITLTRDSETAKDLFQETLFKALANKDRYSVGTNIKAWLYTIMRNIFINDYRKKTRQQVVSADINKGFFTNAATTVSLNAAIATINIKEMQEEIINLPDVFKDP